VAGSGEIVLTAFDVADSSYHYGHACDNPSYHYLTRIFRVIGAFVASALLADSTWSSISGSVGSC
jgi:hypothetical protein